MIMRIPRIFTSAPLACGRIIDLEEAPSRHLSKALRMEAGRELIVFDGQGGEYQAIIHEVGKKVTRVKLLVHDGIERESPLFTHLAIGISRGDKMDWVLQKATELGINEITPLFCERTEVRLSGIRLDKKQQQWHKILQSCCEQCQRNTVPTLNTAISFEKFINEPPNGLNFVLHHRSEKPLGDYKPPTSCGLLIGPEGGLSIKEIELAQNANFEPLRIGPRVMRTETAPLAALSLLQQLWGDF